MEADRDLDHYVLDSSGWISIDSRPDHARILWHILNLVEQGRIKSPPEVWDELVKCHNVLAWIGGRREEIVSASSDADYFALVGQIAFRFPQMCATRGSKEKADGYVVAMATYQTRRTNRRHRVIASETAVNRPIRKIPTACAVYAVECEGIFDMLRREFPDERWPNSEAPD